MSSACRSSEVAGGLEVLNHSDDVLFLTPNQDQDEEEYEDKIDLKEARNESLDENSAAKARDMYANQAQISLLVDTDDLNEDIGENSEETSNTKTSSDKQLNASSKNTEITYLSNEATSNNNEQNELLEDSQNRTNNDEDTSANNQDESEVLNYSNEQLNVSNGNCNTEKANIDESVMSEMKYIFKNTRYFLIKSNNYENVNLAKNKCVWSTPRINEIKLNKAYRECANVLLIFSVAESGRFQGYARLSSECIRDDDLQVNWILPPTLSAKSLNGVFKIDWITKNDLFFTKCAYILNLWNDNRPVKVGRDGQEIEPHAGELLCRQFDLNDPTLNQQISSSLAIDITNHLNIIIAKSKKRHEELVKEKERNDRNRNSDRERSHRDRSSERSDRKSNEKRNSSERDSSHRDTDSRHNNEPISAPYSEKSNYHRKDYHSQQQQSFSHKRNYYDDNKKRHYHDHSRMNNFNQNYNQYSQGGYPYQQQMQANMNRQMNQFNPQQQQPFYPMHHNQQMYPVGHPMNMGNSYPQQQMYMQQSMNMHMQNYPMYPQNANQYGQQQPIMNGMDSYHKKQRDNSSSPKKQRLSNDFVPAAKEMILKSQTYEEYLAAASASIHNVNPLTDPLSSETGQYINYDSLSHKNESVNQHSTNSSKYEQDVEEFLRKTAGISSTGSSQASSKSRYKDEEKSSSSSRSHHSDKKSSSRDKDRDHRHSHRHDHRQRSSSRERSIKRRSRDRK